jgi:phosphoribosylaminoimidazole synthetase
MPGMYAQGDYDMAGFCVGAVDRDKVLPRLGDQRAGDVLVGIGSSGPHSNGYSLIRRIVERSGLAWDAPCPFEAGRTLAQALLTPTRIYIRTVLPHLKAGRVKGVAHITGGGLVENPPRAVADGLVPRFDWNAWAPPPVFDWLAQTGGVAEAEMRRTFNCGVGLVLVVDPHDLPVVLEGLVRDEEDAFVVGELAKA